MVQIEAETQKHGESLNIRISLSSTNIMEGFQNAVEIAKTAQLDAPAWTEGNHAPPLDIQKITQRAIDLYMVSKKPNGEMGGIGWWQTANGYTAMALHDLWTGDQHNYGALANAIRKCESRHKNLIHPFNDDMLWWGMLCVHMYTIGKDRWFLDQARGIWKHVSGSVCKKGNVFFHGRDMEGAVFWTTRPGEEQINSVTTGLFAELSMRLALVKKTQPEENSSDEISADHYIECAKSCLGWILRCRYRPRQGLVLDHIKLKRDKAVDWVFTYNTGVTMGVCALLFQATRQQDYLVLARFMAIKAMIRTGPRGWVDEDGVLTEKHAFGRGTHDPMKPNDAVGFKAVLIRQLCTLYQVLGDADGTDIHVSSLKVMIKEFIGINFRSQLERNTNGKGQYGPWWAGPFECPTSHSQMAALDVMAAMRLVGQQNQSLKNA